MNVVNCSTRLPPTPANGTEPYQVIVKPANGGLHQALARGIHWDGKQWVHVSWGDPEDRDPLNGGTVVAWVDPREEIVVIPTVVPLTSALTEDALMTVTLTGFVPASKLGVIKLIRELTGLGLGEAKAFVEAGNKVVKSDLGAPAAADLKAKIEAAGGVVIVQAS